MLIMALYWTAHMNFPYIDSPLNFLVDEHTIMFAVLGYLIVRRAGHVMGLDGVVANWSAVQHNGSLRWLTA